MAADKALIAGAAKVAGAKAKLDNATLDAFTDLGEDVMKGAESILATMKENQEAYDEEYNSDVGEIRTNALTLDEDVNVSMFGTDETVKKMDDASTAATDELNKVGATNFDFYDASKKGKIFELRKEAQKMSSITNSELDKLNESKKMINDGFKKSQFVEQGNENYMIFDAYLKGNAKWRSGEETKKADRFGYEIEMNGTKRFVTRSEMDEARKYYFQKDNSAEVVDFINNSTKRKFKTATNNAQANIIFKQEKEALLSNMDNLEKLVISQSPNDLQTIKNQFTKNGKFNKENYEDFLKRQGDQYLQEQQALHYTPPEVDDPKEDIFKDAKEFIAGLTLPVGVGMGPTSNKDYFTSPQFRSDARNAGIEFVPEMKIEGTGDDAKEVPTGKYLAAHVLNPASVNFPIEIDPNEPLEAIQGKLETLYRIKR